MKEELTRLIDKCVFDGGVQSQYDDVQTYVAALLDAKDSEITALKAERDALRLEVAQERERCAKICDAEARRYDNAWDRTGYASNVAEDLADEIRGEQGAAMQAQGVKSS